MSGMRIEGLGPERGLAPIFRSRPLWAVVRFALWLSGVAVVFGLLLLASLWFAIPFALALGAALAGWLYVALRVRTGVRIVRAWTRRAL
jgi:hypothetical protein